jgi:hypothetical protein
MSSIAVFGGKPLIHIAFHIFTILCYLLKGTYENKKIRCI